MSIRPNGRPPFRADHIGSLLRPPALRQAFRRHAGREIGDDEFARIQDGCIRDVVRMQQEIGLEVVTDGEFRRGSYWGRFVERTRGLEVRAALLKFRDDHGHEVDFTGPYATAPLAARRAARARRVRVPARCRDSDAQGHAAGAVDHALPALLRFRRPRRLRRCGCVLRRSGRRVRGGDRRSGRRGLPLHSARRDRHRNALRSGDPRQDRGGRTPIPTPWSIATSSCSTAPSRPARPRW